jgi:hypothetical protein
MVELWSKAQEMSMDSDVVRTDRDRQQQVLGSGWSWIR